MFKRFYEDELEFLRGMGSEFGAAYPDIAAELGMGARDPDVERLLEGFAFLTARIREAMDSEFPELLIPLMNHIWPHALRPTPSVCIVEFKPQEGMFKEPLRLRRGARIESKPVEGTVCRFHTCYDLDILPLTLKSVQIKASSAVRTQLCLRLEPLPGASLRKVGTIPIRFYLKGSVRQVFELYLALSRHLEAIRVRVLGPEETLRAERLVPVDKLRPCGWREDQSLLPYAPRSFKGHRHLHEFFLFREKHLFMDLAGLEFLNEVPDARAIEISFDLSNRDEESLSSISTDTIRLHCVPAVNLFRHPSKPVRLDITRAEYLLQAEGIPTAHYDIFSVERVTGFDQKVQRSVEYPSFYSFYRPTGRNDEPGLLYHLRLRPAVSRLGSDELHQESHPGVDAYLSFVGYSGEIARSPTIVSVDLMLTNRDLPRQLRQGELSVPTSDIPALVSFANIGPFSVSAPSMVGEDGLWRYFAQMSLGWNFLSDRDALCGLLTLYNFPAIVDHRAKQSLERLQSAIVSVHSKPERRTVGRPPAVVHGTHVELEMREDRFAHIGELYLFGSALMSFLGSTCPLNTFARLTIHGIDHGLEFGWNPRIGQQALL